MTLRMVLDVLELEQRRPLHETVLHDDAFTKKS